MIEFFCTHCGNKMRVGDDYAGRVGKCPKCAQSVTVPGGPEMALNNINAESVNIDPDARTVGVPRICDAEAAAAGDAGASGGFGQWWARLTPQQHDNPVKNVVAIVVIVLCFIWILSLRVPDDDAQNGAERRAQTHVTQGVHRQQYGSEIEARVVAKEFVLRRLKNPNQAKFPFGSSSVREARPGTYTVAGDVNAQNDFGAMLSHKYRCTVRFNPSTKRYVCEDINVWRP